jgi:hypothetical protein
MVKLLNFVEETTAALTKHTPRSTTFYELCAIQFLTEKI